MADTNTVTTKLIVDDLGSLKRLTDEASKLTKKLKEAQGIASGTRVPSAVAAARASQDREAGRQSGLARSFGEGTGASARDFAKQAEGLGGLVRVYATFAANIFAVSAAFSALSKAADTANMIRGLDQLGAASGRNLGTVAKGLVAATDGAISLREALTATAQASSGGLSNANIIKLGQVAKQASLALGIDMTNAVSRLSRGITKLEPELLDELGIFVRVDKASQDYARSVGKSVTALSDFEKRQAFANAVLEQGAQKFGAIDQTANPYSKIQASLENLTFSALNAINIGLTPLVNILASNPVALGASVLGLGNILLRQAIPAIGKYRENLSRSAEDARKLVVQTNALRKAKKDLADEKTVIDAFNRAQAAKQDALAAQKELEDAAAKRQVSVKTTRLVPTDFLNASNAQLVDMEKRILAVNAEIDKGGLSTKVLANRALEVSLLKNSVNSIKEFNEAQKLSNSITTKTISDGIKGYFSLEAAQDRIADKAAARSQRFNILDDVSKGLPSRGVLGSLEELNKQIDNARKGKDALGKPFEDGQKKMTAWNAAATKAIGVGQILGSTAGTILSSFGHIAFAVTAATVAFDLASTFMSKNKKEAEAYSSALAELESSFDNVDRTMEAIRKKAPSEFLSVESIQASANALQGLVDSLNSVSDGFNRTIKARGTFDSIVDVFKDAVGFGDADKLSTAVATSIGKAIESANTPDNKAKATKLFAQVLKVDPTNFKGVEAALRGLSEPELQNKVKELAQVFKTISLESSIAASTATGVASAITEISKLVNDLNNSLKPNSTSGRVGTSMLSEASKFSEAMKTQTTAVADLQKVVSNVNFMTLLPPEFANELANSASQINTVSSNLGKMGKAVSDASEKYDKAKKAAEGYRRAASLSVVGSVTYNDNTAAAQRIEGPAKAELEKAQANYEKAKAEAQVVVNKFASMGDQLFKAGAERLSVSLKQAMAEGAITAARGYLSVLKDAGGATAGRELELRLQEINAQKSVIESNYRTAEQAAILAVAIERSNLLAEKRDLTTNSDLRGAALDKALEPILKKLLINSEKSKLISTGSIKAYESAGTGSDENLRTAARETQDFFVTIVGKAEQLAKIAGQIADTKIRGNASVISEIYDLQKKSTNVEIDKLNAQKLGLNLTSQAIGYTTEELAAQTASLDLEILKNQNIVKRLDLEKQLSIAQLAISSATNDKDRDAAKLAFEETLKKILVDRARAVNETQAAELAGEQAITKARTERTAKSRGYEDKINAQSDALFESETKAAQNALDLEKSQNYVSEDNAAIRQYMIDLAGIENERQKELLGLQRQQADIEEKYLRSKAEALTITDKSARLLAEADAEKNKANDTSILERQKAISSGIYQTNVGIAAAKLDASRHTAAQNTALAEQGRLTTNLTNLGSALSGIFGSVTESITGVFSALNVKIEGSAALAKKFEEDRKKASGDNAKLAKVERQYVQDKAELELSTTAQIAGSTKKLFKEKTAAYKALDAVEKASHALRMANMIAGMVMDLTATGEATANSMVRATADGQAAVIKSLSSVPAPYNFILAGLTAAYVASIIGKSVGRGGGVPSGATAESQQKVQGTGQMYVDGTLTNRGGGALGDPTAKADSIKTSIDMIEEHTFEFLEYSNSMLKSLKGIEKNTEGLASILLQSGVNLQNVKPDGSPIYQKYSPGLGNNRFANTAYAMMGISGIAVAAIERTITSIFGQNSGISKGLSKIINAVFGGKTTTEMLDSGVQAAGKLTDLAKGLGSLQTYQNLKTTVSGGWFRSDKVNTSVNNTDIAEGMTKETFGVIFAGIGDTVKSAALALGKDSSTINSLLDGFNTVFKVSLQGLKPEEVVDALTAEFSVTLNQLAETVLPEFQKFRKPGEEFGETITRIARNVQVTGFALESVGMSLGDVSKSLKTNTITTKELDTSVVSPVKKWVDAYTSSWETEAGTMYSEVAGHWEATGELISNTYKETTTTVTESIAEATVRITQELIDKFGSLDELTSSISFFNENFLTEVQRLAPIRKRVSAELSRLAASTTDVGLAAKLSSVNTREGFASIVTSIKDLTDSSMQDLYVGLMELAPAFAEITDPIEELTSAAEKLKSLKSENADLVDQYNQLTMSTTAYRTLQESTMDDEAKGYYRLNNIIKDTIKAINERTGLEKDQLSATLELAKAAEDDNAVKSITLQMRQNELNTLDPVNRALKQRIYALQDEASALNRMNSARSNIQSSYINVVAKRDSAADAIRNKLVSLQNDYVSALQAQADAAKTAQDTLRDFAKSILDFVTDIRTSELGLGSEANKLQVLKAEYEATLSKALKGDQSALETINDVARKYLESSKDQSSTQLEYSRTSGKVLNDLNSLGKSLEKKAGKIVIPDVPVVDTKSPEDILKEIDKLTAVMDKFDLSTAVADPIDALVLALETSQADVSQYQKVAKELNIELRDYSKTTSETLQEYVLEFKSANQDLISAMGQSSFQIVSAIAGLNLSTPAIAAAETLSTAPAPQGLTVIGNATNAIPPVGPYTMEDWLALQNISNALNVTSLIPGLGGLRGMLPRFALGGDHVGGMRTVGERGSEIEMTGPSRIISNREIRNALGSNDALLQEMRSLRLEVEKLRYVNEKSEDHNRKSKDILVRVTRNGESLLTEAA